MTFSRAVRFGALGGITVGVACGGGDGGGGPAVGPTQMAISSGNNQLGNSGALLGTPLAVLVRDASSSPVQGVAVNWAVGAGGGSVSAPSSVTDASGIATITRTLGVDSVVQTTIATRAGLTGSPATFTATGRIQGATQMALNAGGGQADTIGATLATPFAVIVRDEASAPVAGVIVNWSVTGGGGSVSAAADTTDATGLATVTRTMGTAAGNQTAQARVKGLLGSPVTFTATANAGVATGIEKTSVDGSAVINSMVTYTVTARDRAGNPRSGVVIDWAATGGGGAISPAQSTTGATGQASATRTLSGAEGPHTATATANSIATTPSVTFTTTATTAPLIANVSVMNDIFVPNAVTIAVTGSVTWNWNSGGVTHNVTFQPPGQAGAPANIPNTTTGSLSRQFNSTGTFNYVCTIHSGMTGSVTVE